MAAAPILAYEPNFGDEIREKVAAVRASLAPPPTEPPKAQIAPKYQNWFNGGKPVEEPKAQQGARVKKRVYPGMAIKELAAATKHNLEILGEGNYDEIEKRMRHMAPNHKMLRSIKSTILSDKPHFGSCRLGKVPLRREVTSDLITVTELQFYVANFDTVISTKEGESFHNPQSKTFGQTYFGVVVDINETTGVAIQINKDYGREGVLFQTHNPQEALKAMTALSSGKTNEEVAELFEKAQQSARPAPAPAGMRR